MRSPAEAWAAITDLVIATLERSPSLLRSDVVSAMSVATPAGLALIAGGHLDRQPITLVAGAVYCDIGTVSGTAAFDVDENLNPVPGAASALDFTLHLPCPDPHGDFIREIAAASPHLSTAAPTEAATKAASNGDGIIDLVAFERLGLSDD